LLEAVERNSRGLDAVFQCGAFRENATGVVIDRYTEKTLAILESIDDASKFGPIIVVKCGFDNFLQAFGEDLGAPLQVRAQPLLLRPNLASRYEIGNQRDPDDQGKDQP
jgi:hypothetical protein